MEDAFEERVGLSTLCTVYSVQDDFWHYTDGGREKLTANTLTSKLVASVPAYLHNDCKHERSNR